MQCRGAFILSITRLTDLMFPFFSFCSFSVHQSLVKSSMFRLELSQKRSLEFSFEGIRVSGCCVCGEEVCDPFLAWGGEISVVNVEEKIACSSF